MCVCWEGRIHASRICVSDGFSGGVGGEQGRQEWMYTTVLRVYNIDFYLLVLVLFLRSATFKTGLFFFLVWSAASVQMIVGVAVEKEGFLCGNACVRTNDKCKEGCDRCWLVGMGRP